jgi:uncharacterized tellurite resistance protein B-like protein
MLEQLVHWLAYGSLVIGAISAYLHLNKMWSRKHIPEVTASISISGTVLEAIPNLIFGMYFLTRGDPVGVIDSIIWLISAICFIMIGAGFWVKGQRKEGLWRLAWRSISSERKEVTNLAQSFLHPESREELINLLRKMAEVDGEVSEEEAALVNKVASQMNININIEPHKVAAQRPARLLGMRTALQQYLQTTPPRRDAEQLEQLLNQLATADGDDHDDEQSSMAEVKGLIHTYLHDDSAQAPFQVLLAPQSEDQIARMNDLLGNTNLHTNAGGQGFTVGDFHTREYANIICREYRQLGFFCVVTDEDLTPAV